MRGGWRRLLRDWRIRTTVPVVAIHLAGFAAIYYVTYHVALQEVITGQKAGANILLDEIDFGFRNIMATHDVATVALRLREQAETHKGISLDLFDAHLRPVASSQAPATRLDVDDVRLALGHSERATRWATREAGRYVLSGVRVLRNEPPCQHCHASKELYLGAIQMGLDLSPAMQQARSRLRLHLGTLALAWLALTYLMSRVKGWVIGRPLAQMERTIQAVGSAGEGETTKDIDSLAQRLHNTIWALIEEQRRKSEDVTRQMARAEQLAALGELAAGLTHELKNPLAGVAAALEILHSNCSSLSPEQQQVFEQIQREVARVTATLDRFLHLGRPLPPARVETDLAEVAHELARFFSPRLKGRRVTLEIEVAAALPRILLDPHLMQQLLLNLVTNALQAIPGEGAITIYLAPFPHRDGVVLAVSDTGKGITAENLDRVFDPFFTTKAEGTGLGLTICRQIVEQHGGTISVESTPGAGTRVLVLLPGNAAGQRPEEG